MLDFADLLVEALGETPHEDRLKKLRPMDDWRMIVEDAQPFLKANGLEIDAAWLAKYGPQIFASAEFEAPIPDTAGRLPVARDLVPRRRAHRFAVRDPGGTRAALSDA